MLTETASDFALAYGDLLSLGTIPPESTSCATEETDETDEELAHRSRNCRSIEPKSLNRESLAAPSETSPRELWESGAYSG